MTSPIQCSTAFLLRSLNKYYVNLEITGIKKRKEDCQWKDQELEEKTSRLYTPGLCFKDL